MWQGVSTCHLGSISNISPLYAKKHMLIEIDLKENFAKKKFLSGTIGNFCSYDVTMVISPLKPVSVNGCFQSQIVFAFV